MGKREMNYIWTPRLQSAGHCCTAAFLDNNTVQRWRPGITPLPAASQELQLLLLTGCSLGTDALLDTAGPWWLLWPSERPGQVQQPPESWNSLLKGIKRKSFPLCLKLMLQINPCHPTEGQLQKRAWSDPNYGISLPCTALTSSVDRPGKLAGPRCTQDTLEQAQCSTHPPAAAACRHVLPKLSGVSMSKPADSTCSLLNKDTTLYFCPS